MTRKISTKGMSHHEWLMQRRNSIGGSDVGTILGFNKYQSAYQLWLDKTGQIDIETESPSEAAYWGNALEEVVAKEFTLRTEKKVRSDHHMYFHKKHSFLSANVDRQVIGENAILECKTASMWLSDHWDGENIPEQYIFQVQHYMNVLEKDYAYIAVLIGGQKFIWKRIDRDQELIDIIQDRLIDFWENNVLKNAAPPIDGSKSTSKFLEERYSSFDSGRQIELGLKEDELIQTLEEHKETKKVIEENITQIENQLKNKLGEEEAEIAITPKSVISWKPTSSNRIDTKRLKAEQPEIYDKYCKTTSYRKFKIKGIK